MSRHARLGHRRTAADLPAPGTTYSRSSHGHQGGVMRLPPTDRRAPCLYPHAPDGRYVLSATGQGRGDWLCYRCLQLASALDRWRRAMARRRAA